VGLGPGDPAWLTPEAAAALAGATDLVGYRPYLARVPVRPDQVRHASGNTVEAERAALALDLAAAGRRVAVVSSGDPGVFAMASAVLEQAAADGERWDGVPVTVLPGVTAAQVVAARAGAPLGHDYCVISLSDRLKPWPVIADRVAHAAAADLVLALYNPASRSRTWQLAAVADLLLHHRSPDTPVVVGRSVGQPGEQLQVITLAELGATEADMATLVIVGSSATRVHDRAGRPVVVTPRHYGEAGAAASSRRRRRTQPAGRGEAAADARP
jgi:precorrin-2 C20-methyltransferase/precorrin-3B C17-methyltransferase